MEEIKKQILFSHIPKCCGTSVVNLLNSNGIKFIHVHPLLNGISPPNSLRNIQESVDFYKAHSFTKFSITRNPYDRFVSLYFFFVNQTESHRYYKHDFRVVEEIKKYKNFEDFCLNFSSFKFKRHFHFLPQNTWTHNNNKQVIENIFSMDSIEHLESFLSETLRIPNAKLKKLNKSNRLEYQRYYNDDLRSIVKNIYIDDIEIFNYSF